MNKFVYICFRSEYNKSVPKHLRDKGADERMGILWRAVELRQEIEQIQKTIDQYKEAGLWTEAQYLAQDLFNLRQELYRLENGSEVA